MNQLQKYALALQILGAKVTTTGKLVTAKNGRASITFMVSEEDGLFGWGRSRQGAQTTTFTFKHMREALGLTDHLKSSTVITRALKTLGMTNRGTIKNFCVHGEYNSAGERIRTIADFYGLDNEKTVVEHWDELKPALDLTGHCFELHECGGTFHYVSN